MNGITIFIHYANYCVRNFNLKYVHNAEILHDGSECWRTTLYSWLRTVSDCANIKIRSSVQLRTSHILRFIGSSRQNVVGGGPDCFHDA